MLVNLKRTPLERRPEAEVVGVARPAALRPEALLFTLLILVHLLPVWLFPSLPSQDGPSHRGVASILRSFSAPEGAPLRELFVENRQALPNVFVFWLMAKGFRFASIPQAEKLVLTLYVLLLPLALRYAVLGINRRGAYLSWLAFPFLYSFLLNMGFYNFCLSLPAFLFAVGFGWRHRQCTTPGKTFGLLLLVTWVYLCHPVTLVVTVATLAALAGWQVLLERGGGAAGASDLARIAVRRLVPVLVAVLPALVFLGLFVAARTGLKAEGMPLGARLKLLAGLYSLSSLDPRTALLAAGTSLLIVGLAALCLRRRVQAGGAFLRPSDGFLAALAVLLVAYFAAPNQMSGGGYIVHRLNLFPFLVLLLWTASSHPPRRQRIFVQAAASSIALGFLFLTMGSYSKLSRELGEIAAAGAAIEGGKTFVYLSQANQGLDAAGRPLVFRCQPFLHAGSAVAAARGAVDLTLYEANEDYFPVQYRPDRNPYHYLSTGFLGFERDPPRVDLEGYTRKTGVPVDYVLLWGRGGETSVAPAAGLLRRQLAATFREIYRSSSGRVRLYRRRLRSSASRLTRRPTAR